MMLTKKIFLASSWELREDRQEFEIFINRKNKDWVARGVSIELVHWEDFLDAVSKTRLQDEYNEAIRKCDLFVMLFWTKVGPYTEEEFETALAQFKATSKPVIFTYFKDAPNIESANEDDLMSLLAFKKRLKNLGHFVTVYKNIDELKLHFNGQLDKLAASGFIEFKPAKDEAATPSGDNYQATLTGNGAITQGPGARAVGASGVYVGGKNTGNINTGAQTKIDTSGGAYVGGNIHTDGGGFVGRDKIIQGISPQDLETLFAPLLAVVAQQALSDKQAAAVRQVQKLKAEVAKGKQADDSKMGKIISGLVGMVPGAVGAVVSMFATPLLDGIIGPVTRVVLDKLKGR
jgi:hypothetical protein